MMKIITGLLQKVLWYTVFSVQYSEKRVFYTEKLDSAKSPVIK